MPTEYTVSCIPEGNINRHLYEVTVSYRGDGRWAVGRSGDCLGADGEWDWEPSPSSREDDWLATHRFDLDTALDLACEAAATVTVNGFTVEDTLRRSGGAR
jgi:hypothetical protein